MNAPAALEAAPERVVTNGPITKFAQAAGGLLVLLGVLGLIPGITSDYDQLGFYATGAQLFGLFATSVVSSSLFILFGATAIAFSTSPRQGHKAVVWIALTLLVAALGGAGLVEDSPSDRLPVDAASNWLHLVLGFVLLLGTTGAKVAHVKEHGVF